MSSSSFIMHKGSCVRRGCELEPRFHPELHFLPTDPVQYPSPTIKVTVRILLCAEHAATFTLDDLDLVDKASFERLLDLLAQKWVAMPCIDPAKTKLVMVPLPAVVPRATLEEAEARMQAICRTVKPLVPDGWQFTVFLTSSSGALGMPGGYTVYGSSAERQSMIASLREWLATSPENRDEDAA